MGTIPRTGAPPTPEHTSNNTVEDVDMLDVDSSAHVASSIIHADTALGGSQWVPTAQGGASQATITHEMSVEEILEHLRQHGCNDVTLQLDESKSSEYPVSEGGFGDVYRRSLRDGQLVSLKCLRLRPDLVEFTEKQLKRTARELYVWSKLNHPNILGLIGVARYRNRIAMVSPWMVNGNLRSFLSRHPQVNRFTLCVQIADGVAYLHAQGTVHGDIKGQDFTPKLADFGSATVREYSLQFASTTSKTGTSLNWAAPEVLEEKTKLTIEADVYSLGMTIFEVATGSIPYAGLIEVVVLMKILSKIHPTRPEEHIPSQDERANLLWLLLTSCWAYDPRDRPTAIQVRDKIRDIASEGLSGASGP